MTAFESEQGVKSLREVYEILGRFLSKEMDGRITGVSNTVDYDSTGQTQTAYSSSVNVSFGPETISIYRSPNRS